MTISKQVTLRISFQDPHFSSKATEDGLFLVNLEAEAEETCFKAGLICHDQEDDLYQISNTLKYYVNIRYIIHQILSTLGTSGDN